MPASCSLFALTCFNYQKPSNADAVCHFMRKPVTHALALCTIMQPWSPSKDPLLFLGNSLLTNLDGVFALREVLLALLRLFELP
jgi:hypothetical protein